MEKFFSDPICASQLLILLYERGIISHHPTESKAGRKIAFAFREKIRTLAKEGYPGINITDKTAGVFKNGKNWSIRSEWFFQKENQKVLLESIGITIQ